MTQDCYSNGKPKGKVRYYLPTFQTEVDVRCFPLSYNLDKVQCGLEPDTSCFCDSPVCHNSSSQQIHVLACFHSFHLTCLSTDGTCVLCEPPLKSLAKQLSENFNKGLMKENEDETEDVTVSDDDNSRDLELSSGDEAEEYYNSQAWQRKVNDIIGTYSNIHHPTKATTNSLHSEKFSPNIPPKPPFYSCIACSANTNWKCDNLAFSSLLLAVHTQWSHWQQCLYIYCTCIV